MRSGSLRFGLLCVLLLAGAAARAGDGVVEINQAKALAGGVTAGDAPGFPVTLSAPGSYRLTSNLDLRALATPQNVTAIDLTADGVSLDFGGFAILGSTVCAGTPPTTALACAPLGTGFGVSASTRADVSIANGGVYGAGGGGISCGNSCLVSGMHVESNGGSGISGGLGSVLRGNTAARNSLGGISASSGSTLQQNAARENGSAGIGSADANRVEGNSSRANRGYGINANSRSNVRGNVAHSNFLGGINLANDTRVEGNTSTDNTGVGLSLGANTPYARNSMRNNTGGAVAGGLQIGTNFCDTDTICP